MFIAKVASFVFLVVVTSIQCDKSTTNVGVENEEMTRFITVMNKLRDLFMATKNNALDMPEIVQVGVEGSGKSSVLESLARRNFLPREEGTRCPIILKLVYTPRTDATQNEGHTVDEWVEFGHKPEKKWTDFAKVTEEILSRTRHLTGGTKGISETPITLTLYSPDVSTITVIDLPGIVKKARPGQPDDIEDQILRLIHNYISKESTIILAVSAANNEISTSDSIKLARSVDPTGERTLAVVTKLDLAVGSTLGDVLAGNVLRLKHGFVGVINQSEDDIEKGLTMDQIRDNEEKLIRKKFPSLASKNGSKFLAQRLSRLLMAHILKQLPGIENKINEFMKTNEEILIELGSDDIPHKANTMSKTLITFANRFASEFEGTRRNINTKILTVRARINMILDEQLAENLAAVDALGSITDDEIAIAILNSPDIESRFTTCDAAYQDLVKTQIKRLLGPCLACVNAVHEEMQMTVQDSLDRNITFQFPRLSESIVRIVTKFLSHRLVEVIKSLEKFIDIESSYVKTSRRDFRKAMYELLKSPEITEQNFWVEKMEAFSEEQPIVAKSGIDEKDDFEECDRRIDSLEEWTQTSASDGEPGCKTIDARKKKYISRDPANIYVVKELIGMYFEIIRQSLTDSVPKLIVHDMIHFSADNLAIVLTDQLHKADKIDDLIQLSADAKVKREEARNELQQLQIAAKIIADVREKVEIQLTESG